jgi:hypothetical protein
MDPVSVILAALGAGASALAVKAGENLGQNVAQDVYNSLKALIKCKFESQGKSDLATILDKYEEKPEKTKPLLEDELIESGADRDEEIIKLAQKLLEQLKPQEAAEGKFIVQISGGTVQGLTQHNTGEITQHFH